MLSSFFLKKRWSPETERIMKLMPQSGIFLTGIEGSDPNVDGVRRNQLLEAHDFYTNYETRLTQIRNLGITWLRFGPPYSQVHLGPNHYDFEFIDKVIKKCDELGIMLMADLLHFGLPDWMHERNKAEPYFQNPEFPKYFAHYVEVFIKRYPHIRYFTIVNEPYVTANFSAKLGLWNEQIGGPWYDDSGFVKAAINIAEAAILGRQAIEHIWNQEKRPYEPIFIQNESFEVASASLLSGRQDEAQRFNLRRFTILDLIFGHRDQGMEHYLLQHGISQEQYDWFMTYGKHDKTILGIDHYPACVHTFEKDRIVDHTPTDPYQLTEIVRTYWQRYPLPLLHTEVNAWPQYALKLCHATYNALCQLKAEGYPILGMGWYGDDLQIGWHVAMSGPLSFDETPVGLFYKGQAQPVSVLFRQFAKQGLKKQSSFPLFGRQIALKSDALLSR